MGKDTTKKGAEKASTSIEEIERIGEIIKNARGTWFVLLGSLVFAAITLASVKDASFFIASEQTKLPLLGISVPVTSFFWAGALLIAALYTYLHLYLVQLWDALGEADARIGEKPLADVIHPWLVSDAALRVRDKRRGAKRKNPYAKKSGWKNRLRQFEWWLVTRTRKCWLGYKYRWRRGVRQFKYGKRASQQRGMSRIGNLVSVLLVWGFGLIIIGWFWWRSMPAHSLFSNDWPFLGLTGWLGILLVWSLYVFWRSGSYALARLGDRERRFPARVLFFACVGIIAFFSFVRAHHDIWEGDPRINRSELAYASKMTNELGLDGKWSRYLLNFAQEFIRPARAEMAEFVFTQKPKDWRGMKLAKQEFRLRWCKQMKNVVCTINPLEEKAQFEQKEEKQFEEAWKEQWNAMLASFNKPDLRRKRLEGADLRSAELEGVRLEKARMQGADLRDAKMQDVDLTYALVQGADLRGAKMQGALIDWAEMQNVNLKGAELQGASLIASQLRSANLIGSQLRGANFRSAVMQMSKLNGAKLQSANFTWANLQGASLSAARMQGSVFEGAELQGAKLQRAIVQSADLTDAQMQSVNLNETQLHGTSELTMQLKSTNFTNANFRSTKLRFVDFTEAIVTNLINFEYSFGDGSVKLPKGMARPEGWCTKVLSNEQYWGRYLGWMAKHRLGSGYSADTKNSLEIPFSEPCPE